MKNGYAVIAVLAAALLAGCGRPVPFRFGMQPAPACPPAPLTTPVPVVEPELPVLEAALAPAP